MPIKPTALQPYKSQHLFLTTSPQKPFFPLKFNRRTSEVILSRNTNSFSLDFNISTENASHAAKNLGVVFDFNMGVDVQIKNLQSCIINFRQLCVFLNASADLQNI